MHEKQVAKILLETKAVSLRTNPPYTWTSGILSPIYTDNRILISFPKEREQIVDFLIDLIEKNKIKADVIAGTATAGIPWAAFIAQKMKKPMVYVKKEAKEYGKEKQIEGQLEKGVEVVVVEDLISTGGSSLQAVQALRDAGCIVNNCVAIFTYQMKKSDDAFLEKKCKNHTLTNFSALVELASANNYISSNEKKAILTWNKDPENWKP